MTPINDPKWVVLKFGGTSVSSAANWSMIADVLERRLDEGVRPVVVHSALSGVSNALEDLLGKALEGRHEPVIDAILNSHRDLAGSLDIRLPARIIEYRDDLARLAAGVHLTGEVSPRVHARILSCGELMATTLGAAWLASRGVPCHWVDARDILISETTTKSTERGRYLSAACVFGRDAELRSRFGALNGVILTQGFIARNPRGETVLLGRGGSDTSASYFAARLGAIRLENWTDVPGMFSADPRCVPSARLLKSLDYNEAQEIASTGGAVLHPRSIPPVRRHGIPMHIRCTAHPELPGTTISASPAEGAPQLKAISARKGLTLVSMETTGMWQQVGFLADAFAVFSRFGLSVDLVSTSETSVTVSLDPGANTLDAETLENLAEALGKLCRVRVLEPCAAVSLVGRQIRAILHKLGTALSVFEEHPIHLVTQAASDLNLSFVVDEDQADRLVQQLHSELIRRQGQDATFGPTWEQIFAHETGGPTAAGTWWRMRRDDLLAMAPADGSAYVYDLPSVDAAIERLTRLTSVDRLCYAVKANPHPAILQRAHAHGLNFDCVSAGEIARVRETLPSLPPERILFTPNFAPRSEYALALELGVNVTLDNLFPLHRWPELFRGKRVFVRVDPGTGRGHHEHVRTAGTHSKFGIPLFELETLAALAAQSDVTISGLHAHSGSGILTDHHWRHVATILAQAADLFPDARVLDLGGGLGVPEKSTEAPLDLDALDASLDEFRKAFDRFEIWLEPGRYLVAAAGVLLTRVTQTKGKGEVRYVGVNTGMNSLIRPALYGSWHEIVNLSRVDEHATQLANVVGPICETGDTVGSERMLPDCHEGDVLLIANAGAYGASMSSHYNLRSPAAERVLGYPASPPDLT